MPPCVIGLRFKILLRDLFSETQPFVDKLFEAVNNKSYLPQLEQPLSAVKVEKEEQKKDEVLFFQCQEYKKQPHCLKIILFGYSCRLA